ncbi:MAG: short-chain dehydrogenase [Planctomyces sp.]|jgi:3-oxoacyl-[acyl-carrier protein] reductase/meso-butanediol dehydrogenase/(S,S)-butanediol dehydrogenase/diacetyl reductase|nr:short-chain dehydrogenase [Planctomyces sp.]
MGRFDGKVAIVTGAGRMRGIGRTAALAFAREGAHVTVAGTGRDPQTFPQDEQDAAWKDVDSVAQEIKDLGVDALALVADVTKPDHIQNMVDRTVERFGRIDFLVNNASAPRMAAWAEFEDLTEEAWRYVMDVKVTGAFLCTQAVTKVMMRQGGGGSIVNVISVEAKISRPTDLAYATASGALYTFTTKAGRALAPHGIRVNGVSPGTTDTARNDALYGFPRSPEWAARVASIPLGRAGTPEEVGEFIAWLCSKEAEFIVGQCIEIDGGQAT